MISLVSGKLHQGFGLAVSRRGDDGGVNNPNPDTLAAARIGRDNTSTDFGAGQGQECVDTFQELQNNVTAQHGG